MKTEKISVQKICMIAFAICINFVGGQIALFLKLPIYLDSIGTVFVAAVPVPDQGSLKETSERIHTHLPQSAPSHSMLSDRNS